MNQYICNTCRSIFHEEASIIRHMIFMHDWLFGPERRDGRTVAKPNPTAVLYTVQPGDTLSKIFQQFGAYHVTDA